jgi:Leucine-rich repeat (LRR) protein
MPNFRLWLFSIITCGSAFSVLAAMERCDMCTCHVDKNVLSLLNCSDIKTKPGDSFGTVRQPHPDTYSHYTFETIEAHFERNRIKTLARISPLRVSKLSLAYNEITAIDSGTFMKLRTLKTLSLHSNKIQAMHEKSFQDLSDLEILDLSQNVLTNLSTDTFIPLKSLRQLSLSHNLIESLKGKIFAISTLQKLDLSFNSINHIEGNIFENANKLITLNISNNNLSTIDNDMFESLASLETLDLSFNKIVIVESHALSHMKSLKWLSLSWNNLTKMPENTKLPADLHVLHLVGNALPELGSNIKNLRLEELYVQRNYLQTLDLNGSRLKVRCYLMLLQKVRNESSR